MVGNNGVSAYNCSSWSRRLGCNIDFLVLYNLVVQLLQGYNQDRLKRDDILISNCLA